MSPTRASLADPSSGLPAVRHQDRRRIWPTILILGFAASYLTWLITSGSILDRYPPLLILSFVFNGVIASVAIATDHTDYSLARVHWYFVLVFFCIAPLAQVGTQDWPWDYQLSTDQMLYANLIIATWCIFFAIGSHRVRNDRPARSREPIRLPDSAGYWIVSLIVLIGSMFYVIATYGWENLVGAERPERPEADSWSSWILSFTLPAVPGIISAAAFLVGRSKRSWRLLAWIALACTVIANNPIYSSRYILAASYLPILLTAFPERAFRRPRFDLIFAALLIVVFPVMYVFKTSGFSQLTLDTAFSTYAGSFSGVDFDSYSLFTRILTYADANGLQFGKRLASSLLYPLPGMSGYAGPHTGAVVAGAQGASFTNVSAPLPSEVYFDFGPVGVLIAAFLFARLLRHLDRRYDASRFAPTASVFHLAYLLSLSYGIFILRGSLQQTLFRFLTALLPVIALAIALRLSQALRGQTPRERIVSA